MNERTVSTTASSGRRPLGTLVIGTALCGGSNAAHTSAPGSVYAGVQDSLATPNYDVRCIMNCQRGSNLAPTRTTYLTTWPG